MSVQSNWIIQDNNETYYTDCYQGIRKTKRRSFKYFLIFEPKSYFSAERSLTAVADFPLRVRR